MAFIYDLSDTWNAGATTFTAIKMNVTDTASAAGSKLIDLQVGGTTRFDVDKNGQVEISAGTALLPSLATLGDTNTGMWFPAADTIAWSTAGSERMRVDSSGNVGIGTSSPIKAAGYTWLTINGPSTGAMFSLSTANVEQFRFQLINSSSTVLYTTINIPILLAPNNAEVMRVTGLGGGRVGIGTTSPSTLLSVNGIASFGAGAVTTPSIAAFGDLNTGMWFPAADTLAWSTGGSERMRVYSSGGVSIGNTTDPGSTNISVSGNIELGNATDTTLSRVSAGTLAVEGRLIPYVFAQTGTAVSVGAVTTEAALATITIPGGAIGPNGWVEIYTSFSFTGSTNTKALRVRAGGISGSAFFDITLNVATQLNYARLTQIINNNSQSSQKGFSVTGGAGTGLGSAALPTASVNTASNWDLVITGQKGLAGDTLTLESYKVVICYGA